MWDKEYYSIAPIKLIYQNSMKNPVARRLSDNNSRHQEIKYANYPV